MRLVGRAMISLSIGLLVTIAAVAYAAMPIYQSCGGGGFSFDNSHTNTSSPAPYGVSIGAGRLAGSHLSFTWSTDTPGGTTLRVLDSAGQTIYAHTGMSGSGSFLAGSGDYFFAIPPPPPPVSITVSWECTIAT